MAEEMGEEINDDSFVSEKEKADKERLQKLNDYVTHMAYRPCEPVKASEHTECLAKAPKKYILGTYTEHKDNFQPKERSERVKSIVQGHTPITIENLEKFIQKHREKQAKLEKHKRQQQLKYHDTLLKLQKQCENQLMNAMVDKFVKMVSKKASRLTSPTSVESDNYQRLHNSLFCDIILTLKIPNGEQSKDYKVYKKLAAVFADFILQALFMAHSMEIPETDCQGLQVKPSNDKDFILKIRSKRAARKKIDHSRRKCTRQYGFLSHHFN